MDLKDVYWDGVGWIDLAQDMGQFAGGFCTSNECSDSLKINLHIS
jgi:hypothetical protein